MSGRVRVLVCFAAFGAFWGAWGAGLPAIQRSAGASDAELGLALLLVGLGALLSMRATGALFDRSARPVTAITVAIFGITNFLPAIARSPLGLCAALFLLGAASGAMDVAINAEAVQEEESAGPLLNLAHAAFSAAVVAFSLFTGLLRAAGAGPELILGIAGVAQLAVAWQLRRGAPRPRPVAPPPRRKLRPAPWLLLLGALCAVAYWIENAWQSWSAVHLERTLEATAAVSALGPAAFAAAAVAGRLAGQRLAQRLSDRVLIAAGGAIAAAGTALAATAPSIPVGLLGIVIAGAGCSVCAPTIISLAGAASRPEERGAAISTVTTIAYLGFLVGPAAVGGLAGLTSLRTALTAVAGLAVLLALAAALAPLPRRPGDQRL